MSAAYVSVTVAMIVMSAFSATVDFIRYRKVLITMARMRVPESWLTPLGLLKAAAAVGLLLGLLGVPAIGEAAAIGLILFFAGAFVVHIRARAYLSMGYPAMYFALAIATLVLTMSA